MKISQSDLEANKRSLEASKTADTSHSCHHSVTHCSSDFFKINCCRVESGEREKISNFNHYHTASTGHSKLDQIWRLSRYWGVQKLNVMWTCRLECNIGSEPSTKSDFYYPRTAPFPFQLSLALFYINILNSEIPTISLKFCLHMLRKINSLPFYLSTINTVQECMTRKF